jgi:hypothetical protein
MAVREALQKVPSLPEPKNSIDDKNTKVPVLPRR